MLPRPGPPARPPAGPSSTASRRIRVEKPARGPARRVPQQDHPLLLCQVPLELARGHPHEVAPQQGQHLAPLAGLKRGHRAHLTRDAVRSQRGDLYLRRAPVNSGEPAELGRAPLRRGAPSRRVASLLPRPAPDAPCRACCRTPRAGTAAPRPAGGPLPPAPAGRTPAPAPPPGSGVRAAPPGRRGDRPPPRRGSRRRRCGGATRAPGGGRGGAQQARAQVVRRTQPPQRPSVAPHHGLLQRPLVPQGARAGDLPPRRAMTTSPGPGPDSAVTGAEVRPGQGGEELAPAPLPAQEGHHRADVLSGAPPDLYLSDPAPPPLARRQGRPPPARRTWRTWRARVRRRARGRKTGSPRRARRTSSPRASSFPSVMVAR